MNTFGEDIALVCLFIQTYYALYGSQFVLVRKDLFNGIVQLKWTIQSLFAHTGIVLKQYYLLSLSFFKHNEQRIIYLFFILKHLKGFVKKGHY